MEKALMPPLRNAPSARPRTNGSESIVPHQKYVMGSYGMWNMYDTA